MLPFRILHLKKLPPSGAAGNAMVTYNLHVAAKQFRANLNYAYDILLTLWYHWLSSIINSQIDYILQ